MLQCLFKPVCSVLFHPADDILRELKQVGFAAVQENVRPADKVSALDKMGKILGLYRDNRPDGVQVQITKVTVVLNHGPDGVTTETRQVVDGAGRVLEPPEEEPSK